MRLLLDQNLSPHTTDIRSLLRIVGSTLGYAYALSGRTSEGVPLVEQALEAATSMGIMIDRSLEVGWLGETYLLAGRIEDSIKLAVRALEIARAQRERGHEAWALRLLGEIAAHLDRPDVEGAEARYREAMTLAGELGMRPLVAHCHFGLGMLYREAGAAARARLELSAAADFYRSMAMTSWLDRAETALSGCARLSRRRLI